MEGIYFNMFLRMEGTGACCKALLMQIHQCSDVESEDVDKREMVWTSYHIALSQVLED